MKSFPGHGHGDERGPASGLHDSGRNSTASTTLGRNSIAGLRSLTSRLRHPADLHTPRHGSPGAAPGTPAASNSNSFAMSRETLVVPEREEGETSGKYYSRLEQDIPKKSIAMAFSKSADTFAHDVLRSLMRTFKFYEEPMDMSLRRFLWEIDLPGEAQQIDRVISAFAERYHECNPHIFAKFDEAYLVAYSLIILHSDLFNRNNKHKMQRHQYQKNTGGHGVHEEILGYFYDNIQYTEFIAQNVDDDDSEKKNKSAAQKAKRAATKLAAHEAGKTTKADPYDAIIDDSQKPDILRPSLRDVLNLEDTYNYQGTANRLRTRDLRIAFSRFGILQVVSARSRPDAFVDPMTMTNPMEAHPGVVDIRVAKVGVLWRKEAKKKKARSPWQEWGAILTPSQLYFFRNSSWVKGLISQFEHHQRHDKRGTPVVFKPPLEQFKYDGQVSTTNAIALQDTNYKRHKNAFVLARQGDMTNDRPHDKYFEEILLADNESEMNDWLAKLNYASTFMTANVNIQPTAPREKSGDESEHGPVTTTEDTASYDSTSTRLDAVTGGDVMSRDEASYDPRQRMLRDRINAQEEKILAAKKKLDENLKTARHLEILAPFPSKTRSDLLAFGARMAYNIKWSRYDFWRCKCQRDILVSDINSDDGVSSFLAPPEPSDLATAPRSPTLTSTSTNTSRLNSKTNVNGFSRASDTTSKRHLTASTSSPSSSYRNSIIAAGIDQAFATPQETISDSSTVDHEAPFKLPPLHLGAGMASRKNENNDAASSTGQLSAANRTSSISSTAVSSDHESYTHGEESFATPRQSSSFLDHAVSDRQRIGSHGSNTKRDRNERPSVTSASSLEGHSHSRADRSVRRSLQRTLREGPAHSPHHHNHHHSHSHRSRRHKDSVSSTATGADDVSSAGEGKNEALARKPGSFKVHGKKASVITLGSEWQQISPEERLRLRRKQQQQEGSTARSSIQVPRSPRLSLVPKRDDLQGEKDDTGNDDRSESEMLDTEGEDDPPNSKPLAKVETKVEEAK